MINFEIGKTYYYIADNSYANSGFRKRICSGVLIRTTTNFCVFAINRPKPRRKLITSVCETPEECLVVFLKRIENRIKENFNVDILELAEKYKEVVAKYPEKFI